MSKKILTLNDGTALQVNVSSTVANIYVTGSLSEVTTAIGAISTETLKNATLGDELIVNKVSEGFSGYQNEDDYTVSFPLREKTENEIINERLDEQDAALMELAEMIVG